MLWDPLGCPNTSAMGTILYSPMWIVNQRKFIHSSIPIFGIIAEISAEMLTNSSISIFGPPTPPVPDAGNIGGQVWRGRGATCRQSHCQVFAYHGPGALGAGWPMGNVKQRAIWGLKDSCWTPLPVVPVETDDWETKPTTVKTTKTIPEEEKQQLYLFQLILHLCHWLWGWREGACKCLG